MKPVAALWRLALTGAVATVLIIAVANVIMADFARRASEEFAGDVPPPTADAPPLEAHSLLWAVIKAYCGKFLRTVGLAR